MIKKEYFPLFAGIVSTALIFSGIYLYLNAPSGLSDVFWNVFPFALLFVIVGLSVAGLIIGVSYLVKKIFKPLIVLGTLLTVCTTYVGASFVYSLVRWIF